jgi:hypothetical protein
MSILNNSNSNIDKILKNDEKRGSCKKNNHQKGKGSKSPSGSEKSMNINYNPGKSHQIFDMTESEDADIYPSPNAAN